MLDQFGVTLADLRDQWYRIGLERRDIINDIEIERPTATTDGAIVLAIKLRRRVLRDEDIPGIEPIDLLHELLEVLLQLSHLSSYIPVYADTCEVG